MISIESIPRTQFLVFENALRQLKLNNIDLIYST